MLIASVLAGLLWDQFGASYTFYAGAVFCIILTFILAYKKFSNKLPLNT